MSAKDQIKQIVDYFKREPQLKDKTDGMAEGLLLGAQLADDANELSKETDASFKALQREYAENGNGSQTTAEITVARDGEPVLADRLNRDFGNVNAQLEQKASINYVDALLIDIAKGGPKDLLYSISALNTKYPNGTDGTVLVLDSSFGSVAHSFMWDSTNSVWKDLGVYKSDGENPQTKEAIRQAFEYSRYEDINLNELPKNTGFYDVSTKTINTGLTYYQYYLITTTAGRQYKYSTRIGGGPNVVDVVFLTANNEYVSHLNRNPGEIKDGVLTVPSGASIILLGFQNYVPSLSQLLLGFKKEEIKVEADYRNLSNGLLKSESYQPFGLMSEGAAVFVDDDGYSSVLTHTKPLAQEKNIPITLSLWSTSEILSNPQEVISLQNAGWEVAQHYTVSMKNYTVDQIESVVSTQKEEFSAKGITNVNNFVYPLNESSQMLMAVSRQYFNICASGGERLNGKRANLFNMSRINIRMSAGINYYKELINQAITDKKAIIFYWHSFELESNADLYNLVGQVMDYATESGIKITTLQGLYDMQ